jgi:hypothetical protein
VLEIADGGRLLQCCRSQADGTLGRCGWVLGERRGGRDDDAIFGWGKVAGNQVYIAATALLSGRAEQSRGASSGSRLMRVRALFLKREN